MGDPSNNALIANATRTPYGWIDARDTRAVRKVEN
jgi:hypothetical protein